MLLLSLIHILLTGEQVSSLKSATGLDEDALAFALLPLAAACARTPLSNFNVGAIARGVSGTWYFGANMEFIGATMQQTVHAEQSAISHAWLSGEKALAAITVNYTPCGHCRQFMNELNSGLDLRIHLPGREAHALRDYLPVSYTHLVHHYQRHRFIIDNRAHHQTMARRIGKTGFG